MKVNGTQHNVAFTLSPVEIERVVRNSNIAPIAYLSVVKMRTLERMGLNANSYMTKDNNWAYTVDEYRGSHDYSYTKVQRFATTDERIWWEAMDAVAQSLTVLSLQDNIT